MKLLYNVTFINNYLKKHNISKIEFCRRCGITKNALNNIYNQKNMNITKIVKVINFLGINCYMFLGI